MTFDEIVEAVRDQLNLTSTESETRVGKRLNQRYKWLTSSLGLNITRRITRPATATIGSSELTFTDIEKIVNVVDRTSSPHKILTEVVVDRLRSEAVTTRATPRRYAVLTTTDSTVTILMDCVPETAFVLYADGYRTLSTLSGELVPAFPESFHDVLYWGTLADEYRKMMQPALAKDAEDTYQMRLSDLRMFIAKSAYLDIAQGIDNPLRYRNTILGVTSNN
jgi:hypothetical protein